MAKKSLNKMKDILEVVELRNKCKLTDPSWQEVNAKLVSLLEKKYKDEKALCIKNEFLPSYIKSGFTPVKQDNFIQEMMIKDFAKISEFIPRAYCEYNSLYKQIIPYVVGISSKKEIFTMERIKGDDRLIGKISIGIGGHINKEDEGENPIISGANREINEEIKGLSKNAYLVFKGFIYDPSDNVGLDHLGFVFFLHLKDSNISIKEKDTLKGYTSDINQLKEKYDKMENWSKILYDSLLSQ